MAGRAQSYPCAWPPAREAPDPVAPSAMLRELVRATRRLELLRRAGRAELRMPLRSMTMLGRHCRGRLDGWRDAVLEGGVVRLDWLAAMMEEVVCPSWRYISKLLVTWSLLSRSSIDGRVQEYRHVTQVTRDRKGHANPWHNIARHNYTDV